MKSYSKVLILTLGALFASSAAFAAKSYEKSYVDAYAGHSTEIPLPVSVVAPEIPSHAESARVEVKFTVDTTGAVRDIAVPASLDYATASALTNAVSAWKFTPAVSNGKPIARNVVVPFKINLE